MSHFERPYSELPRWQQIGVGAIIVVAVAGAVEIGANIPAVSLPVEAARYIIDTVV